MRIIRLKMVLFLFLIAFISTTTYLSYFVDAVSCSSVQCVTCGCSTRCAPAGGTIACRVSFCGSSYYCYSYVYWNSCESVSWQAWKTGSQCWEYSYIGCTSSVDGCAEWTLCVTGTLTGLCCYAPTQTCVSGSCKTKDSYWCSSDSNCASGCCVSNTCVSTSLSNGQVCTKSCECSSNNCPTDYDAGSKHCCSVGYSYNNLRSGCYKVDGQPCSSNSECNSNTCVGVCILDTVPPTITDDYAYDGTWINTDQTVTLDPQDADSGIKEVKYCTGAGCSPTVVLSSPYSLVYNTEQNTIVRYQAWDYADNPSLIGEYNMMIDKTLPSVDAGTDKTVNSMFTQDATATDSLPGIFSYSWSKVSGPGNIIFGSPAAEDTTIWADADGTYTIRLTVTDKAGNSASDEMTLVWDIAEPTTSDNYASDNIWVTADQTIALTPTDPAPSSGISSTRYCIDTADTCIPSTDYTIPVPISSEGISYFRYRSVDNAGNVQSIASRTVKIDKGSPSILIESPLGMTYGTQWIWFNVTATDTYTSVDWCGFSLNGSANITLSEDIPNHFYYFNDTVYLGNYNVVFYCNDSNGLMNSAEVDFDVQYGCTDGVPDYDTKCSVVCGADAECDEDIHGEYKDYCHVSGFTYFIDMCSDACLLIDDPVQMCNNTGTGCGGLDPECDGYQVDECFPDGLHFCNSVCQNETASGNCIPTPVMRKAIVHYTIDPYNRKLEINAINCLIRIYFGAACSDPRRQEYIEIAKTFPDSILPN